MNFRFGRGMESPRTIDICAGKIRNDSTSESARAMQTTAGSCHMIRCAKPPIAMMGANATRVVNADVMTGLATSVAP